MFTPIGKVGNLYHLQEDETGNPWPVDERTYNDMVRSGSIRPGTMANNDLGGGGGGGEPVSYNPLNPFGAASNVLKKVPEKLLQAQYGGATQPRQGVTEEIQRGAERPNLTRIGAGQQSQPQQAPLTETVRLGRRAPGMKPVSEQ